MKLECLTSEHSNYIKCPYGAYDINSDCLYKDWRGPAQLALNDIVSCYLQLSTTERTFTQLLTIIEEKWTAWCRHAFDSVAQYVLTLAKITNYLLTYLTKEAIVDNNQFVEEATIYYPNTKCVTKYLVETNSQMVQEYCDVLSKTMGGRARLSSIEVIDVTSGKTYLYQCEAYKQLYTVVSI
ncbi:hypothetical protein [Alkalihalobacterium bogoriense]|uniref:hypothetical protein n=1 Tax=Alkalihalobacterium bogoriense TaxID=246272 RepID=UPI00047C1EF4|nr:hypothetical protein [Alkalihalobacterium bogoriense]